jgi:hypothetical protein
MNPISYGGGVQKCPCVPWLRVPNFPQHLFKGSITIMSKHENELTPTERAAIELHVESLKSGTFGCQAEVRSAVRHPAQYLQGPLGDLARALFDNKAQRTNDAGFSIAGDNHRVLNNSNNHKSAAAVKNPDGSIDAGVTSIYEPNGNTGATPQTGEQKDNVSVGRLAGGGLQARVNRSGIPLIPVDPERAAREANTKKARGEGLARIALIPDSKDKK